MNTAVQSTYSPRQSLSVINFFLFQNVHISLSDFYLTDGIFETGAYGVLSKSQNPAILGQGGPSSTQCSNPS